ncbi:MAG: N-acetyltransferase family protein [Actinomycetota bacterium]
MRIRVFDERDRPALERLMDAFGDELATMDPHGRLRRAEGMGAHGVARMVDGARGHDGLVVVAEDDGEVVGFAVGEVRRRDPDERFEIVDFVNGVVTELYVAPAARRRGAGRALLGALDERFRDSGCGAVTIEVFAPNRDARAFYAALGFEERDVYVFRSLARD